MSGRSNDYDKGSSRSARDDSRPYKDRREDKDGRDRRKSRSRSPKRRNSPPASSSNFPPNSSDRHRERSRKDYENRKSHKKSSEWEGSDEEEVPVPPPPPRITKISMGFAKPKIPIKMSLGGPVKTSVAKSTVASVFNNDDDDDDEPEEMPAEARMRMRNIGRETPTSAGPNSFGKTKQGFCDAKKVFEKNLKEQLETVDRPVMTKFPQTIYKIKGP